MQKCSTLIKKKGTLICFILRLVISQRKYPAIVEFCLTEISVGENLKRPGKEVREKKQMKKMKTIKQLLLSCIMGMTFYSQAQINYVRNGNFESANPMVAAYTAGMGSADFFINEFYRLYNVSNLPNWGFAGIVDLHQFNHHSMGGELLHHVDLNRTGVLTQAILNLVPGKTYVLRYWTAPHSYLNSTESASANVQLFDANGNVPVNHNWTIAGNVGNTGAAWQEETVTFVASNDSMTLQFVGTATPQNKPNLGILVDSVRIQGRPCDEKIVATKVNCDGDVHIRLTNDATRIMGHVWRIDGKVVNEDLDFTRRFTTGEHIVCMNYLGINEFDTNAVCCVEICDTFTVDPIDTNQCEIFLTYDCGANIDLELVWRNQNCCTGQFTDSTDWIDVVSGSVVSRNQNNLKHPLRVRRVYYDSINCRRCIVTVDIGINKFQLNRYFTLTPCACKSFTLNDIKTMLSGLNGVNPLCLPDINSAASFRLINQATLIPTILVAPNTILICPGDVYTIEVLDANGEFCCFFSISFICGTSPMPENTDNVKVIRVDRKLDQYLINFGKPVPTSSGIQKNNNGLQLVPNPSSGVFKIVPVNNKFQVYDKIEITDASGNKIRVFEKLNSFETIDLTEFPQGMYFVKVIRGKEIDVLKAVRL